MYYELSEIGTEMGVQNALCHGVDYLSHKTRYKNVIVGVQNAALLKGPLQHRKINQEGGRLNWREVK